MNLWHSVKDRLLHCRSAQLGSHAYWLVSVLSAFFSSGHYQCLQYYPCRFYGSCVIAWVIFYVCYSLLMVLSALKIPVLYFSWLIVWSLPYWDLLFSHLSLPYWYCLVGTAKVCLVKTFPYFWYHVMLHVLERITLVIFRCMSIVCFCYCIATCDGMIYVEYVGISILDCLNNCRFPKTSCQWLHGWH